MASNPYVKSLLWLVAFGGAGYGLMVLTEPNAEKIERIKASAPPSQLRAHEQHNALFMKKLQEAASSSAPVYRPSAAG
ncbi:CG15386, partial [Drosophila busckii]